MPYKTPWLKDKNAGIVKIRNAVGDTTTQTGNPVSVDNEFGLGEVDSLSVALNPVQDLNGYDYPWVGGANANLLPPAPNGTYTENGITFTSDNGVYTVKGTATESATVSYTLSSPFVIPSGENRRITFFNTVSSGVTFKFYKGSAQVDSWAMTPAYRNATYNSMAGKTCDGYKINVPSGTTVNITFSPMITETETYPTVFTPYENICPISGHTSATVTSALKNLLQNTSSSSVNHGITFTKQSDSTVVANGTADGDASFIINFTWNLDDGDYQLSGCAEGGSADKYYCFLWDRSANTRAKDWDGNASESSFNPTQIVKVRLEHGVNYDFYLRVKAGVTVNNITFYPMICAKYHGTVYIKYTAKTVTCDFGRTVYGGYLDVTTGVLTVDRAYKTLKWSAFGSKTAIGNYTRGLSNLATAERAVYPPTEGKPQLCDKAPYKAAYSEESNHFYVNATTINMFMPTGTVGDTDISVCYELATPQTYQLTPQQIELLRGMNYISSSDDITLTVTLPGWTSLIDPSKIKHDIYDLDAGNTTGRNLAGEMLRDRVAVKEKLNMEFPPMVADDYYAMLNLIKDQFFDVQYYSPFTGGKRVATMYVGDREGEPYYDYDVNDHANNMWTNVKFNFIER